MTQQVDVNTTDEEFRALVQSVENGNEIHLTRDGRTVARLVPETSEQNTSSELTLEEQIRARQAIENIRALRDRLNLGPFDFEEFKRDRDEGRL